MGATYFKGLFTKLIPSSGIEFSDGRIKTYASGSPEGVITATVGSEYTDTATGILYLKTSGSGNTGWTAIPLSSAGKVLQVVTTVKTDTFTGSSTSWAGITGMSASITPSSTSNTISIFCVLNGNTGANSAFRIVRGGSTPVGVGDASASMQQASFASLSDYSVPNTPRSVASNVKDSPATTSSTTYQVQYILTSSNLFLNRSTGDDGTANAQRTSSSIVLMEVAP